MKDDPLHLTDVLLVDCVCYLELCVLISNLVILLFLNHTQTTNHIPCIIIQNKLGLTIASLSKKVPLPLLVADVEAMAAVQALAFAQNIGLSSIILKGDSKVVMTALESNDDSFAF